METPASRLADRLGPGARLSSEARLSPDVQAGLSDAYRSGLTLLYGDQWREAGTRLAQAYATEGQAAYERLGRDPGAFGTVVGDPAQAERVAGGLWARENVLAQARGDEPPAGRGLDTPGTNTPPVDPQSLALSRRPEETRWTGTDGKPVRMHLDDEGKFVLSKNASRDLVRLASYISDSGSMFASFTFQALARGQTQLNFRFAPGSERPDLLGLHQAHDADGPIPWDSASGDQAVGRFERMPDYVTDAQGRRSYREATITLFESNLTEGDALLMSQNLGDGSPLSLEDALVAVFLHEAFHDMDRATIEAIRTRMLGSTDAYQLEDRADGPIAAFLEDIQRLKR